MVTTRVAAATSLTVALAIAACSETTALARRQSEPTLSLILSRVADGEADSALAALLITSETPSTARYRSAQQFRCVRIRDGAVLDWRPVSVADTILVTPHGGIIEPNYVLPMIGAPGTLGRRDIMPGDVFEIEVITDGFSLRGRTAVPQDVRLTQRVEAGKVTVSWNRVDGAAIYALLTPTEATGVRFVNDTVVSLAFDVNPIFMPVLPSVTVIAMDSNYYRFATDTLVGRSGLSAGYGLFGAFSRARIAVARPKDLAASR